MAKPEELNEAGVPESMVPSAADHVAPSDNKLPEARVVEKEPVDDLVWVRRGVFLGVLVVGWLFIAWANRFYWTAPMVMLCLGFFAVVSTVYALWRTGVTAAAEEDEHADSTWGRPVGARGELEREKRTLLKAIKEAEFDREMGKLSKRDADEMVAVYRMRAIEVIKELERYEDATGQPLTTRQQIEREVNVRLELDRGLRKPVPQRPAAIASQEAPPHAKPMPPSLGLVIGILTLAAISNLVLGSLLAVIIDVALVIGLLSGNDGIRGAARALAVLAIAGTLVLSGPYFAQFHAENWAILGVNIAIMIAVIVILGRSDVRDWMFRRNFNADVPTPAARPAIPSVEAPPADTAGSTIEAKASEREGHDSTVATSELEAEEVAR